MMILQRTGHALIVGAIAAAAVWTAIHTGVPVWFLFLSWVAYFLFGPGWKSAAWATLHLIAGIFIALAVLRLNLILVPQFGQWALIGIVPVVAALLVFAETAKPMNNIPAYYLGAIGMIAAAVPPEPLATLPLCEAVLLGFGFGWLTVSVRAVFGGWFAPKRVPEKAFKRAPPWP